MYENTIRYSLILLSIVCAAPAAASERIVLLLHGEDGPTRWTTGIADGMRMQLGDRTHIREIHLGTSDDDEYYNGISLDIAASLALSPPTGVVANGQVAFSFARKFGEDLFPGAPIIACSMQRASMDELSRCTGCTGIPHDYDIQNILELIFSLRPGTRLVVGIADRSRHGRYLAGQLRKAMTSLHARADLLLPGHDPGESGISLDGLTTLLMNVPPSGVVLYMGYHEERDRKTVPTDRIALLLGQRCPAPVFTLTDALLGTGVVGGLVVTGEDVGKEAARLVRLVENGEVVNEILSDGVRPHLVVDGTAMARFGMKVPEEALVLNPVVRPAHPKGEASGSWIGWGLGLSTLAGLFFLARFYRP